MRQHLFGGRENAHAAVLFGRRRCHEADGAEAGDELVEVAVAGQSEHRGSRFSRPTVSQVSRRVRVLRGAEDDRDVIDEKASGLDEQPRHEGVPVVERKKAVDIKFARVRHVRVPDDLLIRHMRRPAYETLKIRIVHGAPQCARHSPRRGAYETSPIYANFSMITRNLLRLP